VLFACAVAATVISGISGCASSGSSTSGAIGLSDVKSPLQLLRNEAASRVPKDVISSAGTTTDIAVPCESAETDPDQKMLSWESSVLLNIQYASSTDVATLRDDLISSFREQGWTQGISTTPGAVRIQKKSSIATIDVAVVPRNEVTKIGGQLDIIVTGPCVRTAGKDSDEVKRLEGAS
jgi:hypothetical protein